MKALAVCGSPRINGNTEQLLRRVLDRLAGAGMETDLIRLAEHEVKPCNACGHCMRTKDRSCAIEGDAFPELFDKLCEADIVLAGTPVYFGSATPQLMAFLDRAAYVSRACGNLFARKLGGPVVVARRAGHNFTFAQLLCWYSINGFVVPGSSYWNIAFGRQPGEAMNDEEALQTLDTFADNLVWLAGKLKT